MVGQLGVVMDVQRLDNGGVAHHLHRVVGARIVMQTGIFPRIARNWLLTNQLFERNRTNPEEKNKKNIMIKEPN
jgi:hypothetical protein